MNVLLVSCGAGVGNGNDGCTASDDSDVGDATGTAARLRDRICIAGLLFAEFVADCDDTGPRFSSMI